MTENNDLKSLNDYWEARARLIEALKHDDKDTQAEIARTHPILFKNLVGQARNAMNRAKGPLN